jgi:hypothetical protein
MQSRARLVRLGPTAAAAGLLASLLVASLLGTSGAAAQDTAPAAAVSRRASARSEILDPFEGAPRRVGTAMAEIVVEIIDPFEGVPRGSPPRATSEIIDPFRTGRAVISEILDPWCS